MRHQLYMKYLNDLRIQNDCTQLGETGDGVRETCYRVGLNDYWHFNRVFKKR